VKSSTLRSSVPIEALQFANPQCLSKAGDTGSDVSNCNVEMVILRSEFNSQ
jgi:hypothetical protein